MMRKFVMLLIIIAAAASTLVVSNAHADAWCVPVHANVYGIKINQRRCVPCLNEDLCPSLPGSWSGASEEGQPVVMVGNSH
jgi:hypothetical protein